MLNLLNFSIYIGTEDKEKKRLSKLRALVSYRHCFFFGFKPATRQRESTTAEHSTCCINPSLLLFTFFCYLLCYTMSSRYRPIIIDSQTRLPIDRSLRSWPTLNAMLPFTVHLSSFTFAAVTRSCNLCGCIKCTPRSDTEVSLWEGSKHTLLSHTSRHTSLPATSFHPIHTSLLRMPPWSQEMPPSCNLCELIKCTEVRLWRIFVRRAKHPLLSHFVMKNESFWSRCHEKNEYIKNISTLVSNDYSGVWFISLLSSRHLRLLTTGSVSSTSPLYRTLGTDLGVVLVKAARDSGARRRHVHEGAGSRSPPET